MKSYPHPKIMKQWLKTASTLSTVTNVCSWTWHQPPPPRHRDQMTFGKMLTLSLSSQVFQVNQSTSWRFTQRIQMENHLQSSCLLLSIHFYQKNKVLIDFCPTPTGHLIPWLLPVMEMMMTLDQNSSQLHHLWPYWSDQPFYSVSLQSSDWFVWFGSSCWKNLDRIEERHLLPLLVCSPIFFPLLKWRGPFFLSCHESQMFYYDDDMTWVNVRRGSSLCFMSSL